MLQIIFETTKNCWETANKISYWKLVNFVSEGKHPTSFFFPNKHDSSLFDRCTDWYVAADLDRHF